MNCKKILHLIPIFLLLTGCGRDASELTVVTGIGVDGHTGAYRVGTEVIRLSGGEEQQQSLLLSADGQTITDGIDRLAAMTGRSLYCNHAQVLVIGRDTAEQGVLPLLEELLRGNQYPISLRAAVAKETAAKTMKAKATVGDLHSVELEDMIRQGTAQSLTADMDILRLYQDIAAPGIEGVLPFLDMRRNQEEQVCHLSGTALFSGDRLLTVLNPRDSRTLMWMRGQSGGTFATAHGLLEILDLDRTLKVDEKGAQLTLKVSLRVSNSEDSRQQLIKEAERALEAQCADLLLLLKSLNCDAVGFGQRLQQDRPAVWSRITAPWPEVFASYPVRIKVTVDNVVWGRIWAEREASDGT